MYWRRFSATFQLPLILEMISNTFWLLIFHTADNARLFPFLGIFRFCCEKETLALFALILKVLFWVKLSIMIVFININFK